MEAGQMARLAELGAWSLGGTAMSEDEINDAVEAIIRDLSDRRGLRHEWENIDDEIQAEIREAWRDCIRKAQRS